MVRPAHDSIGSSSLEVFIPGPGQNPEDPEDTQRQAFLEAAQDLLDQGLDIAVYSTDSYPSAFKDCEPVADQLAIAGPQVLPILLVEGLIKVSYMYPTPEQLRRFSHFDQLKQPKVKAAAAACGTGTTDSPATLPAAEPAGFAAQLAGLTPKPAGGPDIGDRLNLLGGQDSSPNSQTAESEQAACGCGGCGCGQ